MYAYIYSKFDSRILMLFFNIKNNAIYLGLKLEFFYLLLRKGVIKSIIIANHLE